MGVAVLDCFAALAMTGVGEGLRGVFAFVSSGLARFRLSPRGSALHGFLFTRLPLARGPYVLVIAGSQAVAIQWVVRLNGSTGSCYDVGEWGFC